MDSPAPSVTAQQSAPAPVPPASVRAEVPPVTTSESGIDWQQMIEVKNLPVEVIKEWYGICNRGCPGNAVSERSD
eukprot:7863019-Pyramimonas_sp.AAC.1